MSDSHVFRRKEYLPSKEAIAATCREAGYGRKSVLLRDSSNSVIAFVKYGPTVTLSEARTQDWVAKTVNNNPGLNLRVPWVYEAFEIHLTQISIWHIVMEYIDAPDCNEGDVGLAASAVQNLIRLKARDPVPGPVGGDTVKNLNKHINFRRVDLTADSKDGLYLCPSDLNPGNFKKIKDGPVMVLDFGATCLLPPVFFYLAMKLSFNGFTQKIAQEIEYPYPKSVDTMSGMLAASGFLAQVGPKGVSVPPGFFD